MVALSRREWLREMERQYRRSPGGAHRHLVRRVRSVFHLGIPRGIRLDVWRAFGFRGNSSRLRAIGYRRKRVEWENRSREDPIQGRKSGQRHPLDHAAYSQLGGEK